MITICPACSAKIPAGSRFCPQCGAAASAASDAPTMPPPTTPQSPTRPTSPQSSLQGRFAPGEILAERYRIIALLGRGGMGEVYRADDLKLDQPVALKFLPESLALDPVRLSHFHDEVRIARQVSHRNVCRVYDIGEIDGQNYISMEYVDGEDLATLLRRIGRLPRDKGIEIARQLCAGLAAAHEKGFLHRDLKPANVMIDGRGAVRIMDFGLAALADDKHGTTLMAGTPAYMAPEQLAGDGASVRSDIYALGLVLYEIFTGKAVHTGRTLAEIKQEHQQSTPLGPSSIVEDLDPVVERVILSCIDKDPELRPPSALAVAASLPGGDPLAAALAAGETPSPEIVAAAAKRGALGPTVGWTCFAGALVAILLVVLISNRIAITTKLPMDKPPAVLDARAREILGTLGYAEAPFDHAGGFRSDARFLRYIADHDSSLTRWDALATLRPAAIYYWYRESPRHLIAHSPHGNIDYDDPPQLIAGMKQVHLDPLGRLLYLDVVPPQVAPVPTAAMPAPDWAALFHAAALDTARFTVTDTTWNPPVFCDARAAWIGSFAEAPEIEMRIEAAAYRGRPVYFRIYGPWHIPTRMTLQASHAGLQAAQILNVVLVVGALIGSALIVRRNLRAGQGDRRGAIRTAFVVLGASMLSWFFRADHVSAPGEELDLFVRGIGEALFFAGFLWMLYMALEPMVRRRWPTRIISWSRLLTGRFRDPLVGRDVLFGVLSGAIGMLIILSANVIQTWFGRLTPAPSVMMLGPIASLSDIVSALFRALVTALLNALFFLFFPLLLHVVFRKLWIAIGIYFTILVAMFTLSAGDLLIGLILGFLLVFVWVFTVIRLGLLASAACFFTFFALTALPITTDTSAWFLNGNLLGLGMIVALAIYGLRVSIRQS